MKIIITDDHPLVRAGIRQTIEAAFPDSDIEEAATAAELETITEKSHEADLILLDYFMPDASGFDILDKLTTRMPDTPVIILSACNDPATMRRSIDHGAAGFIPKSSPHDLLIGAIRLVLSGGTYIPPSLLEQNAHRGKQPAPSWPDNDGNPLSRLTARQEEVLRLIGNGMTNKDISRHLNVSENTVKVHITSILKTLGASNRTQAVIIAQQYASSHE